MPIVNRVAELTDEIAGWRHHIHAHPELQYDLPQTADFVAKRLREFGIEEIETGIGKTGIVAAIRAGSNPHGKTIAIRADMDALPIEEQNTLAYRSKHPGKMHACGHDGHSAMLLGAAKYLAETRNFSGTAIFIFQPAEEGGAGAKAMIDDGLMERYQIDEVYGLHNLPGLALGAFALRAGPIMAATDQFSIHIRGVGGHAALPHLCNDPIVAAAQCVSALQTIASRNTDPLDSIVLSITALQSGNSFNVIPDQAQLRGTVRTLRAEIRDLAKNKLETIVKGVCSAFAVEYDIAYESGYPVVNNHHDESEFAASVARQISGRDNVATDAAPIMGGEDFAYMLEKRPGAFIFAGNGDSAGLHHPQYNFNDELIPIGCSYWVKLIETALPRETI